MSGSYRQCARCGKRALSIATRCPGCGCDLPAPEVPAHGGVRDLRRLGTPAVAVLVLAAGALFALDRAAPEPPVPEETSFAPAETLASADSLELASSLGSTASARAAKAETLVARTWTNVRVGRSTRAGLEAVLTPGDTVMADSLVNDWYRVTFLGDIVGYAHRSALTGPAVSP